MKAQNDSDWELKNILFEYGMKWQKNKKQSENHLMMHQKNSDEFEGSNLCTSTFIEDWKNLAYL